jgi:multidrug efflux pump subunit AcrA (membrane-fusion protein)
VAREFVGRVEARRQSRLSLELGGLVTSVRFDEGDDVKQGDMIATLDTRILKSQRQSLAAQLDAAKSKLEEMIQGPRKETIAAARAELARWEAQLRLAGVTRERNARLVAQYAGSQQDLDDATYGQQAFAAQLQASKARLRELENGTRKEHVASQRAVVSGLQADLNTIDIKLQKSTLVAPYSGIVSERFLDEGAVVESAAPVVQLLETDHLDVRMGVSEDVIARLSRGTMHEVVVNNTPYTATVRSVRPDRNQMTRTVSVLLELSARETGVRVGDLAKLRVGNRVEETGFWLPISALTESYRGLWGCYVVVPDSIQPHSDTTYTLQLRQLEVIHQNSDSAFVRGSLKEGELVVSAGIGRLVPNQQVRLATENEELNGNL